MEIQELFAELDRHCGSFSEHLIAEAVTRRDEAIPFLLETLERVDRKPEPWVADQDCMLHIHALYLLALFRETRAYPLIVPIFSRPGKFSFDLAGDVVTQDLGQILASVSNGDVIGMTALIENEHANEYVRAVAMEGMVSLVEVGLRTRDEIMILLSARIPHPRTESSTGKRANIGARWLTFARTFGPAKQWTNAGAPTGTAWWIRVALLGRTSKKLYRVGKKARFNVRDSENR